MRELYKVVPTVTLAALASLSLAAQQTPSTPQPSPSTMPASAQPGAPVPSNAQPDPGSQNNAAVPVPSTANAPEVSNAQLRPVKGELVSKIDSKSAKPGEDVVVKTTEKATTASGVVIPKGSKILGHVTEVKPHDGSNANGSVTLKFDQAELKNGQKMPIESVLQSVMPAPGDGGSSDVNQFGNGSPAVAGGAPMTGTPGGAAGSSAGANPQGGSTTAAMQGSTQAANGAPAPGTVVARQGNVAVTTTAIPGVLIAAKADGHPAPNASGALLGARQNVHLDGGTEIVLAIADVPAQAGR